jgi:signal transduction histidine kinase/CheY-like chemotaxis protein
MKGVLQRATQQLVGKRQMPEQERSLLLLTAIIIAICPVWYLAYFLLGAPWAALWPLAYQCISLINLWVFRRSGSFARFRFVQCALILGLPIGVQLALGGFAASSGVLLWSFLGPILALLFGGDSGKWVGAFCCVALFSAVQEVVLPIDVPLLPLLVRLSFFALNLSIPAVFAYLAVRYYANQLQREKLQQQHLNEELKKANEHKSQFLRHMSHELRTPLNAIIGYAEIVQEELIENEQPDLAGETKQILTASRHLLSLINEVLDLAKIEAGKLELAPETFELEELIKDLSSVADPLIEEKGNRFRIERDGVLGFIRADRLRLKQSVLNLLSNAAKFTENGEVTLRVGKIIDGGTLVCIQVVDTGVGIAPEQMGKLFQDFIQAEPTTAHKYGGTGLGLSLSRQLCRLMGGDITVESTLGKGSTFTITLPEGLPRNASSPRLPPMPIVKSPSEMPSILVVGEDEDALASLCGLLTTEGFGILTAASPDECVQVAKQKRPAAVIVCIPGQESSDWPALRVFSEQPELANIPLLLVTAGQSAADSVVVGQVSVLGKLLRTADLLKVIGGLTLSTAQPPSGETKSVLIIDDDDGARRSLARALERDGYEPRQAANGQEALELLQEAVPGLLVLDLHMPVMDGFAFMGELRRNPQWCSIPVVILSSHDLSGSQRDHLDQEVVRVFRKGDDNTETVLRTVRELVAPAAKEQL